MRTVISCGGRWHAYRLARVFDQRGSLSRLITGYPKQIAVADGLPADKVTSLPLAEILARGQGLLPLGGRRFFSEARLHALYDAQAAARVPPCDLCIGWSSFSVNTLARAKQLGAVTAVERVSTHIRAQERLLREEQARMGLRGELPDPGIGDRELEEYEKVDFIVIPSSFARKSFLEEGIAHRKLVQICPGVDTDLFQPARKTDRTFRVVYVGALSLRKGIPDLLEAFAGLDLPDSELLLIGSALPEIRPVLGHYKRRFRWISPRAQRSLPELYAQGSVFALCSIEDGFGMVLLEAMACGLPVLCTENTGGPDLIENGREGFIVPVRRPDRIREGLERLYRDEELRRSMGQAARVKAERHSWEAYGEEAFRAYRGLVR